MPTEIYLLEPSAIVALYLLDLTDMGGELYRFYPGTNEQRQPVIWQGNTYTPYPIEVTGFDLSTQGAMPRPLLKVSNIFGLITGLCQQWQDMVGGKIIRKRTQVRYLDAINFPGGNPAADPDAAWPDDVYLIDLKKGESRKVVEFELAAATDVAGTKLPRRKIIQNLCSWSYRGAECGYAGAAVADMNDTPTDQLAYDRCGKRLKSCKLRFGQYGDLPFGGFPAAGLFRT